MSMSSVPHLHLSARNSAPPTTPRLKQPNDPRPINIFDSAQKKHLEAALGNNRTIRTAYSEPSLLMDSERSGAFSEETETTLELDYYEKPHKFVVPETRETSVINYINPHSARMQQNDIKQIKEIYNQYMEFVEKCFPENGFSCLTQEQLYELKSKEKMLGSSLEQLHLDAYAQREEKDYLLSKEGKEILFFAQRPNSPLPHKIASKLTKYLNQYIVLDPSNPFKSRREPTLVNYALVKECHKLPGDYKLLKLVFLYKASLRVLCARLNGDQKILKVTKDIANEEEIGKIIEGIKKILKKMPFQTFLPMIADALTVHYIEGPFQQMILDNIAARYLQENLKGKKYSYQEIVDGFKTAFNTETNINPAIEFDRAIKKGFLTWYDKNKRNLLPPYEPPRKSSGEKEEDYKKKEDALVQTYMIQCMQLVGQYVFEDSSIVLNFFASLMEYSKIPSLKNESPQEAQARAFRLLGALKKDNEAKKKFVAFMNSNLWGLNERGMERLKEKKLDSAILIDYLLMFYRTPFPTFINEPTEIINSIYTQLFPDDDNTLIIDHLSDWKEDETKKILIHFEDCIKFQFLRVGAIGKTSSKITQDLTIKVPLPGGSELKDPVSLKFYCEIDENISEKENLLLEKIKEEIAFILNLLKFPPMEKFEN